MEPGLTYYDSRNYVEQALKSVSYTIDKITSGLYGQYTSYKYTRVVSKTYSFTGLSRSTALQCVKEKTEMYTRHYGVWEDRGGGNWHYLASKGGAQTCASVGASKIGGALWEVQIQVNETSCAYSKTLWTKNLDDLFAQYFNWSYDDYE